MGRRNGDEKRDDLGDVERIALIREKWRSKGASWFFRRLREELRTPTTNAGRIVRNINAACYGALIQLIGAPLRFFLVPKDTAFLFYDLEVCPVTFDFCFALVNAELVRKRNGYRHLRVVIVPGSLDGLRQESEEYEKFVDAAARNWRLNNILLPASRLVPSVKGVTVCAARGQATTIRALTAKRFYPPFYWPLFPTAHHPRFLLDEARAGRVSRPFRASASARGFVDQWLRRIGKGRRVVSITLRTYGFMTDRNSNLGAWAAFADEIEREGFFPVFIPDTAGAMDAHPSELAGFAVFEEAAWNMELRMALFEAAWLNMGINNGPMFLAVFSDVRYLLFRILTPSVPMTSAAYMSEMGYDLGVDPAFVGPFQKWVWEDDTVEVLRREFAHMRIAIELREGEDTEAAVSPG